MSTALTDDWDARRKLYREYPWLWAIHQAIDQNVFIYVERLQSEDFLKGSLGYLEDPHALWVRWKNANSEGIVRLPQSRARVATRVARRFAGNLPAIEVTHLVLDNAKRVPRRSLTIVKPPHGLKFSELCCKHST